MRARMGELGKAQGIHAWRSSRIDTKVEDAIGLHGDGDRRQARRERSLLSLGVVGYHPNGLGAARLILA